LQATVQARDLSLALENCQADTRFRCPSVFRAIQDSRAFLFDASHCNGALRGRGGLFISADARFTSQVADSIIYARGRLERAASRLPHRLHDVGGRRIRAEFPQVGREFHDRSSARPGDFPPLTN